MWSKPGTCKLFLKTLQNKYFRLMANSLNSNYSILLFQSKCSHKQYINYWKCLCFQHFIYKNRHLASGLQFYSYKEAGRKRKKIQSTHKAEENRDKSKKYEKINKVEFGSLKCFINHNQEQSRNKEIKYKLAM